MAIRPAAIISRTEGTRTRATTSWIFGAARAARSSTARRLSRRRAPAWRRSCSASGEPKRRERSIAATRVASSLPGTRARSDRSAAPSGVPQESSATVEPQLLGQRPLPRPRQLLEPGRRAAAGAGADREQVEGVGQRARPGGAGGGAPRARAARRGRGSRRPAAPTATSSAVRPGAAGAAASAARPAAGGAGQLRRPGPPAAAAAPPGRSGAGAPAGRAAAPPAAERPRRARTAAAAGRAPRRPREQLARRRRSRAGPRAPPAARRRSLDHPREAPDRDEAGELQGGGEGQQHRRRPASRAAWR